MNGATVAFDDFQGKAESQAHSDSNVLGSEERVKDLALNFLGNSVAVVGDGDEDIFIDWFGDNCDSRFRPVFGGMNRVLDQVHKDLAELVVISKDLNRGGNIDDELDGF